MNGAILLKTLRDARVLLLIVVVAIFGFEILYVNVAAAFAPELAELIGRMALIRRIVRAFSGIDMTSMTATTLVSFGFAHFFFLAISMAFLITVATRVTVGEVDRGTADLLLALPVARGTVYSSASLVWAVCGVLFPLIVWSGLALGVRVARLREPVDLSVMWLAVVNYACLFWAVGGIASLVGAWCDRRGVAVGVVVGVLFASLLISFLNVFLPWSRFLTYVSILDYYRPLEAIRDGHFPLGDCATLLGIAITSWIAGWVIFRHRDIPAA